MAESENDLFLLRILTFSDFFQSHAADKINSNLYVLEQEIPGIVLGCGVCPAANRVKSL